MRQLDPQAPSKSLMIHANMNAKNEDGTTKPYLCVAGDRKGDWLLFPALFSATIDDESFPYVLQLDLESDPKTGVVYLVEFKATKRLDGTQVNSSGLREIPLASLVEEVISHVGISAKIQGNQIKASSLEFNKIPQSEDVIKRAKIRRRSSSHHSIRAKIITNQAEALVRSYVKDWEKKVCEDNAMSRATLRRILKAQDFSARRTRREMKEARKN